MCITCVAVSCCMALSLRGHAPHPQQLIYSLRLLKLNVNMHFCVRYVVCLVHFHDFGILCFISVPVYVGVKENIYGCFITETDSDMTALFCCIVKNLYCLYICTVTLLYVHVHCLLCWYSFKRPSTSILFHLVLYKASCLRHRVHFLVFFFVSTVLN